MAKFFGKIGYAMTVDKGNGVWVEEFTEREYYGDLLRNNRKLESTPNLVNNISVTNEISIVADPFAYGNFHSIRYVEFMGTKWTVNSAEVQYPRLILNVGGIYNVQ